MRIRERARAVSIRGRVITTVMVLTALALTLAGVTIYHRGHAITEQRVAADLERAVQEFEDLAVNGLDRDTGERFTTAESLLRAAVQRSVLASSEGVLGILEGDLRWLAADSVPLRPEQDRDFVDHVLALAAADVVSSGRLTTNSHDYRYVVVPVSFGETNPRGALVRVVDLRVEGGLLTAIYTTYALVALGALVLVGLLIWILVGRLLAPISEMSRTAARITDTDVSQRIAVRGHDDLSLLGGTVNQMLDRLDTALAGQRALLDDVGHELRTPLTIVRGHLELMDTDDPSDVAATRSLVLDELDRMRRLVDDLLTLARSEQPDFIVPVGTDIARLTDETLAKAAGLGPRRWVLDDLADVTAHLDPQRVAQAWLQLAANAVQYSEAGSVVGLGSRVSQGVLSIWVRDAGVGITLEDAERVTQRLARGTGAAALSAGTGLGLAIVSSIAEGHGGSVRIEQCDPVGTRVTIDLPVTITAASGEEP